MLRALGFLALAGLILIPRKVPYLVVNYNHTQYMCKGADADGKDELPVQKSDSSEGIEGSA